MGIILFSPLVEGPVPKRKIWPFEVFRRDIKNTKVQWQRWERNTVGKMDPSQQDGCVRYAEHTFLNHFAIHNIRHEVRFFELYTFVTQRIIAGA